MLFLIPTTLTNAVEIGITHIESNLAAPFADWTDKQFNVGFVPRGPEGPGGAPGSASAIIRKTARNAPQLIVMFYLEQHTFRE